MDHIFISEDFKGLNVHQESKSAELYRQVQEDAEFLRNICMMKQHNTDSVFRPSSAQQYAFYRQRYLVLYNPFQTFGKEEEDKKPMKKKKNKWFIVKLMKKINISLFSRECSSIL